MKRILVGDDGSDPARRAVEIAAELAAKTGAELIALAIVDTSRFHSDDVLALARSEGVDEPAAIETLVAASAPYLGRCREIGVRVGVARLREERRASDDSALGIIKFAGDHQVDLIVVGSRGRGRLPGLLLGSVSQKVASLAPCPVLIAR